MFWSGCWSWRGRKGKNDCGEGVNREGIRGSALATTNAGFGVPFLGVQGWWNEQGCLCPASAELCAAQLPSVLLGRGSIDPSARRQLEHIWLPDEGGSSQPGGS